MHNTVRSAARAEQALQYVAIRSKEQIGDSAHDQESSFQAGKHDVPLGFFILETRAEGMSAMVPGNLIRVLHLGGRAVRGIQTPEQVRESERSHNNKRSFRFTGAQVDTALP